MPTLRRATLDDVDLLTTLRHRMFADNDLGTPDGLAEMDRQFAPWLRERLANGLYIGLILESEAEDGSHQTLATAGVFFMDWPPHFLDPQPMRGYLLNFYTVPEARGHGYAKQLLTAAVEECRQRGAKVITLHASPYGRPIYERFGFTASNEMRLTI